MILYLDTSALVKIFVAEAHSTKVRAAARLAGTCATSRIAYVEFLAALARREREGLRAGTAQAVREKFEAGWADLMIVEVSRVITVKAAGLARAYPLRAYDAVHLACAQEIRETAPDLVFACFDDRLNQAAVALEMRVI